jgi:hypothetical protein
LLNAPSEETLENQKTKWWNMSTFESWMNSTKSIKYKMKKRGLPEAGLPFPFVHWSYSLKIYSTHTHNYYDSIVNWCRSGRNNPPFPSPLPSSFTHTVDAISILEARFQLVQRLWPCPT